MLAYLERLTPIHRLDPRVKIAWSVVVSLLAVILRQPWFLAGRLVITLWPWGLARPPLSRWRFLLAAVGAGAYDDIEEACAATIKVVKRTPVGRRAKRYYDEAFPIYQQLYRSLKDDFKRIAALEK